MNRLLAISFVACFATACSSSTTPGSIDGGGGGTDAGPGGLDSGTLPGTDGGPGPGVDSGGPPEVDAGSDAGTDAGPPAEPCTMPGTTETVPCGMCGTQTRFCTTARVWEYAACGGESGVCVPGTGDSIACGMCGTQARRCNATCGWELFGGCTGETGECAPSTSERNSTGCAAGETHVRTCGSMCMWGAYSACMGTPMDFDGDGDAYGVDCDDTDPTVRVGSTNPCGTFACAGMPFGGGVRGTRMCVGPGFTVCTRPATCMNPPDAFCAGGAVGREVVDCATTGLECIGRFSRGQQTRMCIRRGDGTYGWTSFTACPGTTPRPASCSTHPSRTCGACSEGLSYAVCNPFCDVVQSRCIGGGCTPGTTSRSTTGCPAGEYTETGCDVACTPTPTTMCMPFVPEVDVIILVDVTGSHTALVTAAAGTLGTEIAGALAADMDVRVGVALFADFPHGSYGFAPDVPFRGVLAPTSDTMAVTDSLRTLPSMGGGDGPESGVEALHVLADGAAHPDSDPFTCAVGTSGGGCWRTGAQRIVVMITDISQHNVPHPALAAGALVDPYMGFMPLPPTWATVRAQMASTGTHLFAIAPDASPFGGGENQPVPQLQLMTTDLGQDPAASISIYPSGSTDITAAARDVAMKIAAYTGVMP